jgi:hypothetical protein
MVAQRVVTQVVDDLDGRELGPDDGETVMFGVDGVSYEIDLSSKNARKLRGALEPFIAAGRRTSRRTSGRGSGRGGGRGSERGGVAGGARGRRSGGRGAMAPRSRPEVSREERALIRAWAQANGYVVSARGRISGEVIEAYRTASR